MEELYLQNKWQFATLFDFESNGESGESKWRDKCHELLLEKNVQLVHCHVLLVRDPVSVLGSWNNSSDVHGSNPHPDEIGITQLLDIYAKAIGGNHAVVVIDSDDLADDPCKSLRDLCSALNINMTSQCYDGKLVNMNVMVLGASGGITTFGNLRAGM